MHCIGLQIDDEYRVPSGKIYRVGEVAKNFKSIHSLCLRVKAQFGYKRLAVYVSLNCVDVRDERATSFGLFFDKRTANCVRSSTAIYRIFHADKLVHVRFVTHENSKYDWRYLKEFATSTSTESKVNRNEFWHKRLKNPQIWKRILNYWNYSLKTCANPPEISEVKYEQENRSLFHDRNTATVHHRNEGGTARHC